MLKVSALIALMVTAFQLALQAIWNIPLQTGWKLALNVLVVNLLIFAYFTRTMTQNSRLQRATALSPDQGRLATDPTLQIIHQTLPYLRRGLNEHTALKTVEIVKSISGVGAVAITDRENVLAFVGAACEKHRTGDPILTGATKQVIATGVMKIVTSQEALECPKFHECDCPLVSSVIVPLKCQEHVVGALKLYRTESEHLPAQVVKLAAGIADILSLQIELAQLDREAQLAAEARLDALRAQINPHFLFNTLNTIIMKSRTDPGEARRLLIRLADFFRYAVKNEGHFAPFSQEFAFIRTYLFLEKARFGDKLQIRYDIDPQVLSVNVPVLTIQPLVENAVKHGIMPKMEGGTVQLIAYLDFLNLRTNIVVRDDGVGMTPEMCAELLKPGSSGGGVGLNNIHERLKRLFGKRFSFTIESQVNQGTTVSLRIPLK